MKRLLAILLVMTIFFTPYVQSKLSHVVEAGGTYKSKVEYVKDGDTILLTKPVNGVREVRFLGIDTPETFIVDGKDPGNQVNPHGNAATEYLKTLLPKGTEVTLVTGQEETDTYGRLLAYVYVGNLDINKEMLRTGHAVTYFIWPFEDQYFEPYRKALISARDEKIGVWDSSNPLQELPIEYRDRMNDEVQDKFVGDFDTKKYVQPGDYKQTLTENRVFFFTEQDAIVAGYQSN